MILALHVEWTPPVHPRILNAKITFKLLSLVLLFKPP